MAKADRARLGRVAEADDLPMIGAEIWVSGYFSVNWHIRPSIGALGWSMAVPTRMVGFSGRLCGKGGDRRLALGEPQAGRAGRLMRSAHENPQIIVFP